MITYLDLLPEEIIEIIDDMVINLYKQEHIIKQNLINKEINTLWLYTLWGAGFKNDNLINNIYSDNFCFNNSNNQFLNLINIVKYSQILTYIKPSMIKHIKYRY